MNNDDALEFPYLSDDQISILREQRLHFPLFDDIHRELAWASTSAPALLALANPRVPFSHNYFATVLASLTGDEERSETITEEVFTGENFLRGREILLRVERLVFNRDDYHRQLDAGNFLFKFTRDEPERELDVVSHIDLEALDGDQGDLSLDEYAAFVRIPRDGDSPQSDDGHDSDVQFISSQPIPNRDNSDRNPDIDTPLEREVKRERDEQHYRDSDILNINQPKQPKSRLPPQPRLGVPTHLGAASLDTTSQAEHEQRSISELLHQDGTTPEFEGPLFTSELRALQSITDIKKKRLEEQDDQLFLQVDSSQAQAKFRVPPGPDFVDSVEKDRLQRFGKVHYTFIRNYRSFTQLVEHQVALDTEFPETLAIRWRAEVSEYKALVKRIRQFSTADIRLHYPEIDAIATLYVSVQPLGANTSEIDALKRAVRQHAADITRTLPATSVPIGRFPPEINYLLSWRTHQQRFATRPDIAHDFSIFRRPAEVAQVDVDEELDRIIFAERLGTDSETGAVVPEPVTERRFPELPILISFFYSRLTKEIQTTSLPDTVLQARAYGLAIRNIANDLCDFREILTKDLLTISLQIAQKRTRIDEMAGGSKPHPQWRDASRKTEYHKSYTMSRERGQPMRAETHKDMDMTRTSQARAYRMICHPPYVTANPTLMKPGVLFPPDHVMLPDNLVGRLVELCHRFQAITKVMLAKNWGGDFSLQGYPHMARRQMGPPATMFDPKTGTHHYMIVAGSYTLMGEGHVREFFRGTGELDNDTRIGTQYPWNMPGASGPAYSYSSWTNTHPSDSIIGLDRNNEVRWDLIKYPSTIDVDRTSNALLEYLLDDENKIPNAVRVAAAAEPPPAVEPPVPSTYEIRISDIQERHLQLAGDRITADMYPTLFYTVPADIDMPDSFTTAGEEVVQRSDADVARGITDDNRDNSNAIQSLLTVASVGFAGLTTQTQENQVMLETLHDLATRLQNDEEVDPARMIAELFDCVETLRSGAQGSLASAIAIRQSALQALNSMVKPNTLLPNMLDRQAAHDFGTNAPKVSVLSRTYDAGLARGTILEPNEYLARLPILSDTDQPSQEDLQPFTAVFKKALPNVATIPTRKKRPTPLPVRTNPFSTPRTGVASLQSFHRSRAAPTPTSAKSGDKSKADTSSRKRAQDELTYEDDDDNEEDNDSVVETPTKRAAKKPRVESATEIRARYRARHPEMSSPSTTHDTPKKTPKKTPGRRRSPV